MNVSVVIATINREKELKLCINSINSQTILPKEIIIVDDGNLNPENIKQVIADDIAYKYHRKDKPSLSASRNMGAELAESELILFLDDDMILEPNYIEEIINVFANDKNKELGGVSGVIVNRKKAPHFLKYWEKVFLHNLGRPGQILPWGFYSKIDGIDRVIEADWVPGGLSCFRREVFKDFQLYDFEEFNHRGGRHGLADIEFCLRINKRYKFAGTPFAKLYHYTPQDSKEKSYRKGYKKAFNHGIIFQKYSKKTLINILCFLWAMAGLILGNLGAVLIVKNRIERKERFNMALGNLAGFVVFLSRR